MGNKVPEYKRNTRCRMTLILLVVGSMFFLLGNLIYGSISVSMQDVIRILMGQEADTAYQRIVMDIRFPRAIAAFLLGGALALSGYLLQTFFHNPIAGPFVLGISSGSKLAVSLVMVFLLGKSVSVSSAALIAAAFAGALSSMGLVLLMSRQVRSMSLLVVGGVMIGYICTAVTDVVVTFAEDADIINLHNWSRGSFSGMSGYIGT